MCYMDCSHKDLMGCEYYGYFKKELLQLLSLPYEHRVCFFSYSLFPCFPVHVIV